MTVSTSCKMASSDNPGDTVAASVFEPVDTSSHVAKSKNNTANIKNIKDSIVIIQILFVVVFIFCLLVANLLKISGIDE